MNNTTANLVAELPMIADFCRSQPTGKHLPADVKVTNMQPLPRRMNLGHIEIKFKSGETGRNFSALFDTNALEDYLDEHSPGWCWYERTHTKRTPK
jgi:transcription antitermination factor NusG